MHLALKISQAKSDSSNSETLDEPVAGNVSGGEVRHDRVAVHFPVRYVTSLSWRTSRIATANNTKKWHKNNTTT